MKSDVFFISSRAKPHAAPADRFRLLLDTIGLGVFKEKKTVAIKIHFGETGSTGFVHPVFPQTLVQCLKQRKCKPFLTDTNTLYHGSRSNGIDHLTLAIKNGFGYDVIEAPLVIADGIRSHSVMELPAGPRYFETIRIGAAIWEADSLITMNHFKGHLVTSFGGAIKNISMGCASRSTKQRMHSDVKPELTRDDDCIGCGECALVCPVDAISISHETARFNHDVCVGCAECVSACTQGAIKIQWSGSSTAVQEKMAEVALAVSRHFRTKQLHINFLLNITPECDCLRWTDNPIVQNIGILASHDPVALDQASYDLVKQAPGLPDSALPPENSQGKDKFILIHPGNDPDAQLRYGEEIGLGTRSYRLVDVK